ncbi:uncharacterized protein A1O9_12191 [Exophiala aquamarina CBS 119918]|uniref:Smr domain-containing protein n=1 Tax=Exophiala aquamarina CBS 119918 TaxID=1182545 RepID=A0A072NXW1_9EURO|nr:uncharacterized protein A1O9_12191 [Exophiala aquamarina CBS 119918]KEF51853.1 hypothetical protein A1O9_12191 [Exophiala aquamarina CBS 119918]
MISVLNSLKTSAIEQDAADFDPSGTGGPSHQKDHTDTSRSNHEDAASTGVTSITTGLSELLWTGSDNLGHDLNDAPLESKTAWLSNVFPDIPRRELGVILESHAGSLDKATDELLNLSFLYQGTGDAFPEVTPVPKGVEAFAEDAMRPRKGRKKRRNRTTDSSRTSSASSYLPDDEISNYNVWSTMSDDVQFICSRTDLPAQTVRSIYHSNGARLGRTIRALAIKEAATKKSSTDDPIMELQIAEFTTDFESVPKAELYGLLTLARNIPSAARELLEVMMDVNRKDGTANIALDAQYAPIKLEDDQPLDSPSSSSSWTTMKPAARDSAAIHRAAASHSFNQASAAFKKSKSDRLMGGAAAYYSQVGHDRMRVAKEMHAAEADALVARQSSTTVLDLHGVSVADAVRIASDRTQSWWDGLGDAKYASGGGGPMRAGFKIVTGVGTHSKNHAPRIGPAVSKMLIRDGWRVEIGHGEVVVTGKTRRS